MVCRKVATYYRPVLFSAPNSISRLISASSPLWGAFLHVEIALQITEFVVNCVTSCHRNLNFLAPVIKGVLLRLGSRPGGPPGRLLAIWSAFGFWQTLAMRDWELVLYKYVNVSVLELSAPSVRARRTARLLSRCWFDTAGALPLLPFFFSLSLFRPFFFRYSSRPASNFCVLSRRFTKIVLFLSILQ